MMNRPTSNRYIDYLIMVSFALLMFVGIPLAFFAFLAVKLELLKEHKVDYSNYSNCRYLDDGTFGPEDITKYNQTTLLLGSSDFGRILILGEPLKADPGSIYAIYNADQDDFQVVKVPIHGFPENVAFNPHGIYVAKFSGQSYLYAVSHGYSKGGERVEGFVVKEEEGRLALQHFTSILFPKEFIGKFNDLVFLDPQRFLVTEWLIQTGSEQGPKADGKWEQIKSMLIQQAGYKLTQVQTCSIPSQLGKTVRPICFAVEGAEGQMNNGITTDGKFVYVADTFAKTIKRYVRLPDNKLQYNLTIQLESGPDNIEYDPDRKKIVITTIEKQLDFLSLQQHLENNGGRAVKDELIGYWTGIYELDPSTLEVKLLMKAQNASKGSSGAYPIGKNLFIGSFADVSVVVCKKV